MSYASLHSPPALALSGSTGCPNGSRSGKPECFLRRRLPLAWLLAAGAWACGASREPLPEAEGPGAVSSDASPEPVQLRFKRGQSTSLGAGTTQTLEVVAEPPGVYPLQLSTDAVGAFLDKANVSTDSEGVAQVVLRLAEAPEPFEVRVQSGEARTQLRVTPTFGNTATLLITPSYSGERTSDNWYASVHPRVACQEFGLVPPDGTLRRPVKPGNPFVIEKVPAGINLAVVVRAESKVGGCADVPPLRPNSEQDLEINAIDRPLHLGDLKLDLDLSIETSDALGDISERWIGRQLEELDLNPEETAAALLDAIGRQVGDVEAFNAARSAADWDAALANSVFGSESEENSDSEDSPLIATTRRWMREATQILTQVGGLRARVVASAPEANGQKASPRVTMLGAGGLAPLEAGLPPSPVEGGLLSVGSDELLRLGTDIEWDFARYLREGALLAAKRELAQQVPVFVPSSVSAAWAHLLPCSAVAATLTAATKQDPGLPECDDNRCVERLCEQGLDELWQLLGQARNLELTWAWTASGAADIGPNATPTRVTDGSWTGSMKTGDGEPNELQGRFVANPPPALADPPPSP